MACPTTELLDTDRPQNAVADPDKRTPKFLSLDIETTTEVEGLPEGMQAGLDQRCSSITDVSLAARDALGTITVDVISVVGAHARYDHERKTTVLDGGRPAHAERIYGDTTLHQVPSEMQLLQTLASVLANRAREATCLTTWNGSVFDLPFIIDREAATSSVHHLRTMLQLAYDPKVWVKYDPLPGHEGGYRARIIAGGATLDHLDVAPVARPFADEHGIKCSLKPVGRALGFDPIEVDASKMHLLSDAERAAYVGSDAILTLQEAEYFAGAAVKGKQYDSMR